MQTTHDLITRLGEIAPSWVLTYLMSLLHLSGCASLPVPKQMRVGDVSGTDSEIIHIQNGQIVFPTYLANGMNFIRSTVYD